MSRPGEESPHLASTVLIVRDGEVGLEVFMERRHIKSDFVGGAYVFPGGRVDPDDSFDEVLCVGPGEAEASARLGIEEGGLAFFTAAIRECFEEAGVLFAYRQSELLDFSRSEVEERFRTLRDALNRGDLSLAELVRQEGVQLALDCIHYWSHWITPEGQPRRYDTRFFIAEAPANQTAVHDDWELTNSAWVTPSEAITRALDGEWKIILPTFKNLERLACFETSGEAVRWAKAQAEIPTIQPRILQGSEGEARVVLPGDPGYSEAERDTAPFDQGVWEPRARPGDS